MIEPQTQAQELTISYHTVTLGPLARNGDALAEITMTNAEGEPQSLTLHVPAGLPGERVTIALEAARQRPANLSKRAKRYWKSRPPRVWITEIHEPSPLRVETPCPVFGTCGGCQLQHMRYEAQLEWKRETVRQLLQEVGGFAVPPLLDTVPCDIPWHYRNHMRFSVNRSGQLGLTARGTHRVLPLTNCPIAHEDVNNALHVLTQYEHPKPQVLIRCGVATKQMLIQPVQADEIAQKIGATGTTLCTETMEEQLAGHTFRIRPSSFFQTNTAQAEKMAQMILHGLFSEAEREPHTMTIVDAYCGVGTFAALLAPHVGQVIAIEESASAIKDAQWNLRETPHVELCKGKVEDVLPTLSSPIDGFVIDPPRAGCQQVVLDALLQHPVARIVYVSCDPSTLARDLHILCHTNSTYRLRTVQPLDMFPQTAHIETIAILERNS